MDEEMKEDDEEDTVLKDVELFTPWLEEESKGGEKEEEEVSSPFDEYTDDVEDD